MDDYRARKVVKAHGLEPTAAPFPHPADRINESCENGAIDQIRLELHAASDRT